MKGHPLDITFIVQPDGLFEEASRPLMVKATRKVLSLTGGEAAAIWLQEDEGKALFYGAWYPDGSPCPSDLWPDAQSLCQLCHRQSLLLIDGPLREELGMRYIPSGFGRGAFLCLPLRIGGRLVGAVTVSQPQHPTFWPEIDLETLKMFAHHLAFVVEQVRIERGVHTAPGTLQPTLSGLVGGDSEAF